MPGLKNTPPVVIVLIAAASSSEARSVIMKPFAPAWMIRKTRRESRWAETTNNLEPPNLSRIVEIKGTMLASSRLELGDNDVGGDA